MTDPATTTELEALDRALMRLVEVFESEYVRGPLEQILGTAEEVTSAQLRTLNFLAPSRDAWIGDIAAGLGISYPAATKAVDRLCERGLAERIRDDADARRIRVTLTARGQEVVAEVARRRRERLEAAARRVLPAVSVAELRAILEGFAEASRGS
ncbi:DNA-binding MarR family transcriptional regulator [Deinobacterium chartae]|uniref:DNA-binding MarR family transcriptional regulator n=1 Tax=Deinobacterium chartae TaxID=521158 RepID=A0A841I554_9DEIO|nr:MarR family winged helix-turn-helix transcriptional regulator [Deinobacterium chartae]MBB6099005.1 DNA-binding MarR family transcriptional regulator [Deinobacterium chartae]